jgi:hypothetical protein
MSASSAATNLDLTRAAVNPRGWSPLRPAARGARAPGRWPSLALTPSVSALHPHFGHRPRPSCWQWRGPGGMCASRLSSPANGGRWPTWASRPNDGHSNSPPRSARDGLRISRTSRGLNRPSSALNWAYVSQDTLKRNSTTSPSRITYSLPSTRAFPAALTAAIDPASMRSS